MTSTKPVTRAQAASVEVDAVSRNFDGVPVLRQASIKIRPGEVIAILGPSGCGKSTLLRLIAGLDTPSAGTIRIGDKCVSRPGAVVPPELRPVNMVFQDFALWPHMTVERIVRFGMRYRGVPKAVWASRTAELLGMLGLEGLAQRYPRQLSGGQQQRVAIARALATDPQVILFDEPLSNLDAQLRIQMRIELAELLQRLETTAIYVTHDIHEAVALGHRLVVMRSGQVEQVGSAKEVFQSPSNAWIAGLVGYNNELQAEIVGRTSEGHLKVSSGGSHITVRGQSRNHLDGNLATVRIRPEAVRPLRAEEPARDDEQLVTATVEQCCFEGYHWRVVCRLGDEPLTFFSRHPLDAAGPVQLAIDTEGTCAYTNAPMIDTPPQSDRVFDDRQLRTA
ncbi:ABC transporter ATP-binding protein [Halorhodospira halochloris]|uniref:ABC transporter ATP-binding protein n=1 Tax=Halorhodospira halochloris TaxID=1052 RepID=UPI001EE80CA9|nr:ABC transporter ATP-binding protein [Halorhodospira halochloris]MCG5531181.1 ABC transporter ATP-binding protein [Halorhodospira halochloris]